MKVDMLKISDFKHGHVDAWIIKLPIMQ